MVDSIEGIPASRGHPRRTLLVVAAALGAIATAALAGSLVILLDDGDGSGRFAVRDRASGETLDERAPDLVFPGGPETGELSRFGIGMRIFSRPGHSP